MALIENRGRELGMCAIRGYVSAEPIESAADRRLPELLRAHFLRSYRGRPDGFLFATSTGNPLPRSTFTTVLRRRLGIAQRRLPVAFDLRRFSGISFRKGCLSLLGSLNVPAYRLADHADHGTVDSSRAYTVDTVNDRAANSDLLASAVLAG